MILDLLRVAGYVVAIGIIVAPIMIIANLLRK